MNLESLQRDFQGGMRFLLENSFSQALIHHYFCLGGELRGPMNFVESYLLISLGDALGVTNAC